MFIKSSSLFSLMFLILLPFSSYAETHKAEAFSFGFITGAIPIAGQMAAALAWTLGQAGSPKKDFDYYLHDACFLAGHAVGMSVWVLPWYLIYRQYSQAT